MMGAPISYSHGNVPAMNDVRPRCSPLEVIDPLDEGHDRMRIIWDSKVGPAGVMELLHFATIIALYCTM